MQKEAKKKFSNCKNTYAKKTENNISKKAEMQKKQKMHFNLKINARKGQKWEKESTFIWIFLLLYPLCIFCILNLKIHIKKRQKCKKKSKKNFSNCKNTYAKKKHEISFQKNMQKKKHKCKKKAYGV